MQGVIDLKRRCRREMGRRAYTAYKGIFPCIGCDSKLPRSRQEHNRVEGECKYHDLSPEEVELKWTCPGCTRVNEDGRVRPRARGHPDHTNDPATCRMPHTPERRFAPRNRGPGHTHPREGRQPAAEDPDGNATTGDLTETDEVRQTPNLDDEQPRVSQPSGESPSTASSSSGPTPGTATERATRSDAGVPRGPIVREFPPSIDENSSDWTRFNIDKSLRILKVGTVEQRRKELRKLHLRWWHAPRTPMEHILKAGGIDEATLSWIPDVIDTCRACRAWQPQRSSPQTTIDLPCKQNEKLEADILFYETWMIWHMIDKADRWHNGVQVLGKSSPELQEAIATTWLQLFGPFKFLIIDGEKGISSKETIAFLKSFGCQLEERARGQHARMIERRGALLRHSLHCTKSQLEKEGVTWTFNMLLANCIFAGNALTNVGGTTPYVTRFGSTPAMLPDIDAPQEDGIVGVGRNLQRIRMVSLQKVIEATAIAKIKRALNTKTSASGEQMDYRPGELVDHYTDPKQRDVSGWRGPAEVIENMPERGRVKLKWVRDEFYREYRDVRRFMDFFLP